MSSGQPQSRFNDLLLRYSQELEKETRLQIENEIWEEFGTTITPMVVDMSGFTRLCREHGVVHYLSMVRRMQLTAEPIIEAFGGQILKFEADNAFAYFDSPGDAIRAAVAMNLALDAANILTPEELDIHISVGIDHGRCLFPHASDFCGSPVNHASKLGEDLAAPGQILVTEDAMSLVPKALGFESKTTQVTLGGREETVHDVIYRK